MIPLRDQVRSRRWPLVTFLLIGINIYIFIKELLMGAGVGRFFSEYALVPAAYLSPGPWTWEALLEKNIPVFSALFIHGGWLHLIGNMWYLWIFGDNVEDKLGHARFLGFYIACGIIGNLSHVFANSASLLPAVGASGCIAGVLGAYLFLFPGTRITTLLPVFIFWTVAEVPAFFFLGIWFLLQFLNGYIGMPCAEKGDCVAWWAHIGGFMSGVLLIIMLGRGTKRRSGSKRR